MVVSQTGLGGPLDKVKTIKDVDDIIMKLMDIGERFPRDQQGLQSHRLKIIEELKGFRLVLSGAEFWTSHRDDNTRELEGLMGNVVEEFPELVEGDDGSLLDVFENCGLNIPEDLQSLTSAEQFDINFVADLDPDVIADLGEAAVIVLRSAANSPNHVEEDFIDLYEEIVGSPPGQVVPGSPGVSFGLSPSHEFHEEEQQPPQTLQRKPRGKNYQFAEGQEEERKMIMDKMKQRQKKTSESDHEAEPSCALPFLMRRSLGHNSKRFPAPVKKTKKVETEKNSQVNATVYFLRPRKVSDAAAEQVHDKKSAEPVAGCSKALMSSSKKGKAATEAKKKNKKAAKEVYVQPDEIETDTDFEFEEGSELSRRSQKLLKKMKPANVKVLNLNLNIHDTRNSGKSKKEAKEVKSSRKVKEAPRAKLPVLVEDVEEEGDEVPGNRIKAGNNLEEDMDIEVEDGAPSSAESNDVHDDSSDSEDDVPLIKAKQVRRCRLPEKLHEEENDKAYRVVSTRAGCRYSLRKLKRTTTTAAGEVMSATACEPGPEPKLRTKKTRMTRATAAQLGEQVQDQVPLPQHTRQRKGSKPTPPPARLLTVRESSEKEVIVNVLKTVASILNLNMEVRDVPKEPGCSGTPGKRGSSPNLKKQSKKSSSSRSSRTTSNEEKSLSRYNKYSADDMNLSDTDFDL